ncbi:hypothetical protein FIU83_00780 [Halomonas sp. THAF5a]|uniref:hypothetical protein n=1 Tax=Halomonas sp. THAF5a TaxID=2587844 RepID=UPI0012A8425D|nr:hypothetical protein [Halomonas sp. THAF5a]QFU00174.1 hypothetical protein FIU83_00780 [Halomonas sp. THAF5a]
MPRRPRLAPLLPLCSMLLLSAGLLLAGPAAATNYNTSDVQAHGGWHSLALTLGEARHFRALDQQSYGDAILSVNASAGACDLPWLELRVELDDYQPESATVNRVPADARVDHAPIRSGRAAFVTERGDRGFYVRLALPELDRLLAEMADGELLRLRLMRGEDDPWYMAFALAGAGEAIARMRRLCAQAPAPGNDGRDS